MDCFSSEPFDECELLEHYKESNAVKNRIEDVRQVFRDCRVKKAISTRVITKLIPYIIPAGVKAKIKGDLFNEIVKSELKKTIKLLKLNTRHYKMFFETPCKELQEIPDWTLHDARTNKLLIGYNQIDLWNGGHQLNRGSKYILDDHLHKRLERKGIFMVCVVNLPFPSSCKGSKIHNIVTKGHRTKRLIHPRELSRTLKEFVKK
jgi:hypothetical protein